MSIRPPGSTSVSGRPLVPGGARTLAALTLFAAAGIHLAQALGHLPDRTFHGRLHLGFFLAAALSQVVIALAVAARLGRRQLPVMAAGNLGLAALWLTSVSLGLPDWLGPATREPVTRAGFVAAVVEVLAAAAITVAATADSRNRPDSEHSSAHTRRGRVPAPLAAAGLALVVAGWALPIPAQSHESQYHQTAVDARHASSPHSGDHTGDDLHLHGLGGDPPDPGPDPVRQRQGQLAGHRLAVGVHPAAIAVDGGVVWVADREAGLVHRLDAPSGRPLGPPTQVGLHPGGIAVGAGAVWVTNAGSDTVSRLDSTTGENLGTIPVGSVPVGVAVGTGLVWVANSAEGTVSRIDVTTGNVATTPRIGYGPTAITVVADRPWVVASLDRAVVSLDPETGTLVTETPVDAGPASIAFGHGSLWVASSSAGTVTRIDPLTGARIGAPIVVDGHAQPGQGPAALAVGTWVGVLNNHDKTVVTIDPSTHAVSRFQFIDRRVARHITPASLALSDAGELWATEHDSGLVVRLQPPKETR